MLINDKDHRDKGKDEDDTFRGGCQGYQNDAQLLLNLVVQLLDKRFLKVSCQKITFQFIKISNQLMEIFRKTPKIHRFYYKTIKNCLKNCEAGISKKGSKYEILLSTKCSIKSDIGKEKKTSLCPHLLLSGCSLYYCYLCLRGVVQCWILFSTNHQTIDPLITNPDNSLGLISFLSRKIRLVKPGRGFCIKWMEFVYFAFAFIINFHTIGLFL